MTSARVVIFGLVAAVLAGGVVGVLLGAAVAGPAAGFGAAAVTAAVVAAIVGFVIAFLFLRPGRAAAAQPAPVEHRASGSARRATTEAAAVERPAPTASPTETPTGSDTGRGEQSLGQVETAAADTPADPPEAPHAEPAQAEPEPEPAGEAAPGGVLVAQAILLEGRAGDRDTAIAEVGRLLVESGAVEESYVDSMRVRENSVSTFMGSQLAIPHGTTAAKALIKRSAVAVVRYPDSITWHGNPVRYVVAIAGAGDDHLKLVSKVAEVFLDSQAVAALENAQSTADVLRVFSGLNAKA